MGRYSNNKDYEQSVWNNLWNAPNVYQLDLTTDRGRINLPRCHLTFAFHVWSVMQALASIFLKIFPYFSILKKSY